MLKIAKGARAPEEEPTLPEEVTEPVEEEEVEAKDSGEKIPQKLVLYMGGESGPFQCDNCCYFEGLDSCSKVEGEIDPAGMCHLYCPPDHEPEEDVEEEPAEEEIDEDVEEDA